MNSNSRMIINSCIIYARAALTVGISLLSSRWILMALGEEDFGIYNLVAGMIVMLSFLNNTMSSSTQRFLSYSLGKGVNEKVNTIFNQSLIMHIIVAFIMVMLFETAGVYFLNHVLDIPIGKKADALFVLHCLSLSTFVTVATVPYSASLITHENMLYVACVQIVDSLLKLFSAIALLYFAGSRIRLYAICMMGISTISALCYVIYCQNKYSETKVNFTAIKDISVFKKFASYTGWNMIGGISHLFKSQGTAILLNAFYGVTINAAYGIANQVNSQLKFFSSTIVTATRPQIVKSEGMGNRQRMLQVSTTTCKLTFLMLSVLVAPFIAECDYILQLWLKEVPEYTGIFIKLFLLCSLVMQLHTGVSIGIESVGSIKKLQIFVGGMHFLILPIGYVMLRLGCSATQIFYMLLIEEICAFIVTSLISRSVTGLNIFIFAIGCVIPCCITFVLLYLICSAITTVVDSSFFRLLLVCSISVIVIIPLSSYLVFDTKEKDLVKRYVTKIKDKIRRK